MNTKKIFKKFSAIVITLAILFTMPLGKISVKASDNPVKMYYCDIVTNYRGVVEYNVYIQIDSKSASNKSVYVHSRNGLSQGWDDVKAEFVMKQDNDTEIWKAKVSNTGGIIEYAIKYIGDGITYWDNNNGNNYTHQNVLGTANVKSVRLAYQHSSGYGITAVVKNLAYDKIIKVRYTFDNWNTWKESDLSYYRTNTERNTEDWSTSINLEGCDTEKFQYCISYTVNNQTYWDNNFGLNYNINFYRPIF